MSIDLNSIKKILIIQYQPFGDVLLNTGYLPVLRRKFPNAKIDFLVRKPYQIVLEDNPNIDNVISFKNGKGLNYIVLRLNLILRIHRQKYDLIIDQIRNAGSAQITLFSGAKYRLGFDDRPWKFVYNYLVPRKNIRYYSALKFDLLQPLGISEEPHKLFYKIKDESKTYVKDWLKQQGLIDEKFICFSPGSPVKTKQWDLNNYARLADLIIEKLSLPVVILWGPAEKQDAEKVISMIKGTAILAPPTTFNQAAAFLQQSALLVCNDGGLNHLSVATETPSIAIFGKHGPRRWSPVIFENHFHFHKKNNNYKTDSTFGISAEEVFDKVELILGNQKSEDRSQKSEERSEKSEGRSNQISSFKFQISSKYLFYIAKTYSISIIRPLAAFLESRKAEYRFYVSVKVKEVKPDEWKDDWILTDLKDAKKFNPDFVLCPGNFVDFRIPGIKVQLFHGLGVEKAVHYKIRHFFDIYLTSGPFVSRRYDELRKNNPYFLILETGWPKIDYILNFPRGNLKKEYDIPEGKKIILYAPTFSTQHESATALLEIIPDIMGDDEYWLFKFHELMDKHVVREFKKIDPGKGRVLENAEITPYLHAADVMISDTSSVIYEFMVLDKPVVTYKTQAREDKGINITEPSQLREALDRSIRYPMEFSDIRHKHLSEINPYLDGKISENVIMQLEKVKKESMLPEKRKPLNLFRKLQIIYHGHFRKGYLR